MESSDWRAGRSQAEQQLYMLEHGLYSDCTFTLAPEQGGETREFRLHRNVLARSSEVFEAMLLPSGERMLEAQTGRVTITDIQPDIFHIALKFVYSGDCSEVSGLPLEEVLGVSGVADKYRVPLLQAACERRLCALLDPSCVWRLLGLCHTLQGYLALKDKCVQLLRSETPACLGSADFAHATEDSVVLLLQQEQLQIESEMSLVLATVTWARNAAALLGASCSVRSVLEPRVLPLLRLSSLSAGQLDLLCGLADWLSETERAALKSGTLTSLPECFCKNLAKRAVPPSTAVIPATPPSEKIYYVDRNISLTAKEVYPNSCVNTVLVEVSSAVWLRAIFFSRFHHKACGWEFNEFLTVSVSRCTAEIHHDRVLVNGTTLVCCRQYCDGVTFYSDVENKVFFHEPLRLLPGETYAIEIYGRKDYIAFTTYFKHSLEGSVCAKGATFTFNRRGTAYESRISGRDILHGLLYSI